MSDENIAMPHEQLQCRIIRLECDFARKEAWLCFPEGDCCDMDGCVAFVTAICPKLERIHTKSGTEPDTAYFKVNDGWRAMAWVRSADGTGRYRVVE